MKKQLSRNEKLALIHGINKGINSIDDLQEPEYRITLNLAGTTLAEHEAQKAADRNPKNFYITLDLGK